MADEPPIKDVEAFRKHLAEIQKKMDDEANEFARRLAKKRAEEKLKDFKVPPSPLDMENN